MEIKVGTGLQNDQRQGWRSVSTAGTNIDLRRARLLAKILEICGYKATAGTTTAPGLSTDDTSGWTEAAFPSTTGCHRL
jgi:hypothetical protein